MPSLQELAHLDRQALLMFVAQLLADFAVLTTPIGKLLAENAALQN